MITKMINDSKLSKTSAILPINKKKWKVTQNSDDNFPVEKIDFNNYFIKKNFLFPPHHRNRESKKYFEGIIWMKTTDDSLKVKILKNTLSVLIDYILWHWSRFNYSRFILLFSLLLPLCVWKWVFRQIFIEICVCLKIMRME